MLGDIFRQHNFSGTLLDLGCGPRPYYNLYKDYFSQTIGADLQDSPFPKKGVDLYCNAIAVPLPDSSVDVILCTEVLHDIAEPSDLFAEVKRLLRPGGTLILTTPFVVPIVDGSFDHYRYTRFGLEYLVTKSGLTLKDIRPVSDTFGSSLTIALKPILKVFNVIAKKLRFPGFYSVYNPLLFLLVALPQYLYLLFFSIPPFRQLSKRFSYGAIGYVTVASKPATA